MLDALALPLAAVMLVAAFASLALLQERHRQRVSAGCGPARWPRTCAATSTALALAALAACIAGEGVAFGVLAWGVMMGCAALAIALCLAWWPALLRPLVRAQRP